MKMNQWFLTVGIAAGMCLGASNLLAQSNNNSNARQGRPGRGGPPDPAQQQQRQQQRMDQLKADLEVTDDAEWKAMQPLIQKVMDIQREAIGDRMRGFFGRRGGGPDNGNQGGPRGPGGFGQTPSPEADALQKAIDGKASNAEMKAAIAKYQAARQAKQAELDKAQADLRKVLSVRQEGIATSRGLL